MALKHTITFEARVTGPQDECNLSVYLDEVLLHDYGHFASRSMAEYAGRQAVKEAAAIMESCKAKLLEAR